MEDGSARTLPPFFRAATRTRALIPPSHGLTAKRSVVRIDRRWAGEVMSGPILYPPICGGAPRRPAFDRRCLHSPNGDLYPWKPRKRPRHGANGIWTPSEKHFQPRPSESIAPVFGRMSGVTQEAAISRSIEAYAKYVSAYDRRHGEIFNDQEQARLGEALAHACAEIRSGGRHALDYGAGSGNLTRHLVNTMDHVTAADVSPQFLDVVSDRFGVPTVLLHGGGLEPLTDDSLDFIGLYSVLHHIPDYLATSARLVRKLRPGGVLFFDHEHNENFWDPPPALQAFREDLAATPTHRWWDPAHKNWQFALRAAVSPYRHAYRIRRWLDPRYSHEGDIHIWPDDHIEFAELVQALEEAGAEVVARFDYLLFKEGYDPGVWERHAGEATDTACLIVRRRGWLPAEDDSGTDQPTLTR